MASDGGVVRGNSKAGRSLLVAGSLESRGDVEFYESARRKPRERVRQGLSPPHKLELLEKSARFTRFGRFVRVHPHAARSIVGQWWIAEIYLLVIPVVAYSVVLLARNELLSNGRPLASVPHRENALTTGGLTFASAPPRENALMTGGCMFASTPHRENALVTGIRMLASASPRESGSPNDGAILA